MYVYWKAVMDDGTEYGTSTGEIPLETLTYEGISQIGRMLGMNISESLTRILAERSLEKSLITTIKEKT